MFVSRADYPVLTLVDSSEEKNYKTPAEMSLFSSTVPMTMNRVHTDNMPYTI